MQKRGQQSSFGMSFGMIFSIFLIVVFIITAFVVVKFFLNDFTPSAEIGMFKDEFQEAVNNAWKSQSKEFEFEINLPSDIEQICFANLSADNINRGAPQYSMISAYEYYGHNLYLIPPKNAKDFEHWEVDHLDIVKITGEQNPYCVKSDSTLKIKKDFYDKLVVIE